MARVEPHLMLLLAASFTTLLKDLRKEKGMAQPVVAVIAEKERQVLSRSNGQLASKRELVTGTAEGQ